MYHQYPSSDKSENDHGRGPQPSGPIGGGFVPVGRIFDDERLEVDKVGEVVVDLVEPVGVN
jgi:hypothetical protein